MPLPRDDNIRLKPERKYQIELVIDDKDYTNTLSKIKWVSSLSSIYPIIIIDMFIDPIDILVEKIHGQDEMKLTIKLTAETGQPQGSAKDIEIDLVYLEGGFPLVTRDSAEGQGTYKDRAAFSIVTVPKQLFKVMSTLVNETYENTTIQQILNDLVGRSGGVLNLDSGTNPTVFDQVLIPPMPLTKAIKYLDKTFGIFDNPSSKFTEWDAQSEESIVHIKNLRNRLNRKETIIVHQIATDADNREIVNQSLDDPRVFYTFATLVTNYNANSKITSFARNTTSIVYPSDRLFHHINKNLQAVAKNLSLSTEDTDRIFINDIITNRKRYYINDVGYEVTENFANAKWSKMLSNISEVQIPLERNLPFELLLRVGDSVLYKPKTLDYQKIGEKYILLSTNILFERQTAGPEWETTAILTLIRTARETEKPPASAAYLDPHFRVYLSNRLLKEGPLRTTIFEEPTQIDQEIIT